MSMIPLSEVEVLSAINDSIAKVVLEANGDLARVDLNVFTQKIKSLMALDSSYVSVSSLQGMYPDLVKSVESTTQSGVEGILVTYWNDDAEFIPAASSGGGFAVDDWDIIEDQDTGVRYLHLFDEGGNDLLSPLALPSMGGGGTAASDFHVTNSLPSRAFSVITGTQTVNLVFNATCTDIEDSSVELDMSMRITVNGSVVRSGVSVAQGQNTVNVAQYLAAGIENTVVLTVEDVANGTTKTLAYKITTVNYELTWNLEDFGVHGSDSVTARVVATGNGTKTLHVSIDGSERPTVPITTSGRTTTVTIPAQNHGAHAVEMWLTATVDGETVSTAHLRHIGIWTMSGSTLPVVGVYESAFSVPQLDTHPLRFFAYNPASETATVAIAEDSGTPTTVTVGRTAQTYYYRGTAEGSHTLTLQCGGASATVSVTVTDIGVDVSPITTGLIADLNPAGHTNTESNRTSFGYVDGGGTSHPLIFSNGTNVNPEGVVYPAFDWVNGGFQVDENGHTAFVVRRGCRVWLDRSFFADAGSGGKSFEVIYKSANVRDPSADIMRCYANGIGLRIKSNLATFSCDTSALTLRGCEGRITEFVADFEPATGSNLLMAIYEDGVLAKEAPYDAGATWMQSTPENFVIGSDDADVWIYRFKAYDAHLNKHEINANFIADALDVEEIVARARRNDIYTDDKSAISIQKLIAAAPNQHVIHIRSSGFPTDKDNQIPCFIEHWLGDSTAHHWWTTTDAGFVCQGTSSLNYLESRPNLDIDMTGSTIVNGDGNTLTGYAMTANSIPVKYFNLKANVASSENANNACGAEWFNRFNPLVSLAKHQDPRVRDTVEGHPVAVFYTNTGSAAVRIGNEKSQLVQPGETILLFCGDMNNSKKNFEVFGQTSAVGTDGDGIGVFCVEAMDNGYPRCLYLDSDFSGETWKHVSGSTNGQFEFRYPKKPNTPTQAMKDLFIQMQNWVCSTNPVNATGAALSPIETLYNPFTGQNETFIQDTALYRGCKFRAGLADWFDVDGLCYYYVFTEHMLGVDQRCKNTFISYEPDENGVWRFNYSKYYDSDTILGINNKGAQVLDYGMEDTDQTAAGYVYNGRTSVLWCNLRDYCGDWLADMRNALEVAGCFDHAQIGSFWRSHQRARPEALQNEDYGVKYERPYKANGTTSYLVEMLNGEKYGQREEFLLFQEVYMATKYQTAAARNNSLLLNTYAPQNMAAVPAGSYAYITPYCDMYLVMKFDNFGTVSVRAKAGVRTLVALTDGNGHYVNLNDTATQIYYSAYLKRVELPQLYTQMFSGPDLRKMIEIDLGSSEVGYENSNLSSFGINAPMLEVLNLCGLTALSNPINLSNSPFLETLLATNSGITGVTFADGAGVETAALPAITSLSARNLTQLQSFVMGTANIARIRVENTPGIDTESIVEAATTIQYGRFIGVDWHLSVPDALLRLIGKIGIDAEDNIGGSLVIIGDVEIDVLTQSELDAITAAFPDLNVTYGSVVAAHTVTFKGADNSTLYTEVVRHGADAIEPISAGYISSPTKAPTVENTYAFSGWSASLQNITADLTVTPNFISNPRRYTVRFYASDNYASAVVQTSTVAAHGSVQYTGSALTPPTSKVWGGWQSLTNDVVQDMDVLPWFIQKTAPTIFPAAGTYDYLYSDDPNDNSAYTFEEFWYLCDTLSADTNDPLAWTYFTLGDKIKMVCNTTAFSDTTIILQLEAFKHFKTADAAGWTNTVWGMVGIMNAQKAINSGNVNTGGYPASTVMRPWLNTTVYTNLPLHWQAVITQAQVLSSKGGQSSDIVSSSDYLFLRSYTEVQFGSAVPYGNEIADGADSKTFGFYTSNTARTKKSYN
ncbi:MAG: hypothetical protein IJI27_07485, partial [Oscillospiraceae bacterium]|nr:hypothetical protein [Oscillospiraceae bacterium]